MQPSLICTLTFLATQNSEVHLGIIIIIVQLEGTRASFFVALQAIFPCLTHKVSVSVRKRHHSHRVHRESYSVTADPLGPF